ncbi:MAG TPA: SMP-30/gluconolactonase/LRE family protein [Gaiellaceae bacterium]
MIELRGAGKATLAEGPIWDSRYGRLFWVDIMGGAINVLTPGDSNARHIEVGEHVGCIALTARADTVVGALRSGWYWIDVETGQKQLIAASPAGADCRFNDGAVDRAGRFWVGTMEYAETSPVGELYLLAPDLSYRSTDRGFICSNGITWSSDRRWMFFVDSRNDAVYRYRFDDEEGRLEERSLFVDTTDLPGVPDGIEMDSEDTLWCSFWDGGQIVGFDSDGKERETIAVPAIRPTSLTFGGPDLTTMFITTAAYGLSERELAEWPGSGAVFELERPTPGLPANVFAGEPWAEPR